ncbi:hypothetical protein A3B21_02405 [Candidatus Uhrbacteria bacterium RIFCSPLOWO2_01_FULL_47_24]|uniref:SspI n=1 Tax=Candidatus Uhrbacteria bacterium RIFCSPLOWO2_01_FULL_47_24 TaxID=1802401 RepID=A0A1F7UPH6_9BACT|nr:MAG: hypothetical protein A2753_04060 [Candidatus Uhrbacteria bacterium RIFCSPHIGHO2_01_FULL_47_11]OGL68108.1 MAG: hypothetical protein A3D58_00885 [Candidatus Uhrbacteria bacterium RIFCSPHIGHO2_02_FULL_46_47]OGL75766.1 MAG: hypothetical protein A3F52_03335 [Candidatus Uhrbacteria bacterium RIFCSPHIGHO2_12_FULL_47_11]OGL80200.1 MAG: hypothetical protein A3B21_02405 [Candidatus Uhrbacteria bacterium RIFCSPLOWO2_01_FULL_47_24]OGL84986.1 MAG: hypothetical protein A3J03_04790 [Candidatus Uhrbact
MTQFENFKKRFKLLASKNKSLIVNTLSNIFTMRLIGNKTHGDLAEIGMVEFVNQFMYDFKSIHVGKDLFRAKEHEEDIMIINEITKEKFPVSLKTYGDGPLQLSTDSDQKMFPFLEKQGKDTSDLKIIKSIFSSVAFANFGAINILPLIYNETNQRCNIMIFDHNKAINETKRIVYIGVNKRFNFETQKVVSGKGRSHPIFMFVNDNGGYICEVRYGGASANALQRGLWTHTKNALPYFESLTSGWIDYSHNHTLVKLFGLALNSTEDGHKLANQILQKDIDKLKRTQSMTI